MALPLMATDSETHYLDNVQWAKGSLYHNQNKPGYRNFDVNSWCQNMTCQQAVTDPNQSRYYHHDADLIGDAQRAAGINQQSRAVTRLFSKGRPVIDSNEQAYRTALGYQKEAYNISHGISTKYHDCENGLTCEVVSAIQSCTTPTDTPFQCHIRPYVNSVIHQINEQPFNLVFTRIPHTLTLSKPATLVAVKFKGNITVPNFTAGLRISINGKRLGDAPISIEKCASVLCSATINSRFPYPGNEAGMAFTLNTAYILTNGNTVPNTYLPKLPVILVVNEAVVDIGYTNSCGDLLPECQRLNSQCMEGEATRIIDGVAITLDCWHQQLTYQCHFPRTCGQFEHCPVQTTQCDISVGKVCVREQVQRLCESQLCRNTGLICGEDSFALSGDYYEPSTTRSLDFDRAAAGLAAGGEAGKDVSHAVNIDAESAIIFQGKIMRCTNKPIGMSNCCQDRGWGNSIGITSCSEEEKALGTAKEAKLTIGLGEYCAGAVLGVCIRKKKSYCAFSSKLARIVQEGGKAQLGLSFGSAKNPNCRALTPHQLQRINFNRLNFSDFYEDLHAGMNVPDMDEIRMRLQQAVGGD